VQLPVQGHRLQGVSSIPVVHTEGNENTLIECEYFEEDLPDPEDILEEDDTNNEDGGKEAEEESQFERRAKQRALVSRILGPPPNLAGGRLAWLTYQKRKWKIQAEDRKTKAAEKNGKSQTTAQGSGLYHESREQEDAFKETIDLVETEGG
jgi:hypothetical protein